MVRTGVPLAPLLCLFLLGLDTVDGRESQKGSPAQPIIDPRNPGKGAVKRLQQDLNMGNLRNLEKIAKKKGWKTTFIGGHERFNSMDLAYQKARRKGRCGMTYKMPRERNFNKLVEAIDRKIKTPLKKVKNIGYHKPKSLHITTQYLFMNGDQSAFPIKLWAYNGSDVQMMVSNLTNQYLVEAKKRNPLLSQPWPAKVTGVGTNKGKHIMLQVAIDPPYFDAFVEFRVGVNQYLMKHFPKYHKVRGKHWDGGWPPGKPLHMTIAYMYGPIAAHHRAYLISTLEAAARYFVGWELLIDLGYPCKNHPKKPKEAK